MASERPGAIVHTELILGGQRSGKSRCAESRATAWLAAPGRSALLIATALPGDDDMRERIDRHRADRLLRAPGLRTLEAPHALAEAIGAQAAPGRLLVVDCLTLWLTNLRMPADAADALDDAALEAAVIALVDAVAASPGPVVLVGNEIGLGVVPMGREARRFVDDLGWLHQAVATRCAAVTLMVAGIEMAVKRP